MNRLLYLGPENLRITHYLKLKGYDITRIEYEASLELFLKYDYYISFGYRYIISEEILNKIKNPVINIHVSYLPWNRGADPNIWSFLEDTHKGVSIHRIEKGTDTGAIYLQKEIFFEKHDTLRTSYDKLIKLAEDMFLLYGNDILKGYIIPKAQKVELGTYHKSSDKEPYLRFLTEGYDTPIENLIGKGVI